LKEAPIIIFHLTDSGISVIIKDKPMAAKKKTTGIKEADVRIVKWMLKKGKTKKACCQYLNIAYNTKRLEKIIQDFEDKVEREAELKKKAKTKVFSDTEKSNIAKRYIEGEAISAIATSFYMSSPRIKKILIEKNVPLRGRKKRSEVDTDHVVQDLEIQISVGDKAQYIKTGEFVVIKQVYDENWVDYFSDADNFEEKFVRLCEPSNKYADYGDVEDIHFNVYYEYKNGDTWKRLAIQEKLKAVSNNIVNNGLEQYQVAVQGDYYRRIYVNRDMLFPVREVK